MSVKMALAKLSATAAGGALLAGGAVHVAETPITDAPSYKSTKSVKAQPVKYVKKKRVAERRVPKTVKRKRRIVKRVVECEPYPGGMVPYAPGAARMMGPHGAAMGHGAHGAGADYAMGGAAYAGDCAPQYQMAMAAVPLPPAPMGPINGGGGGGVTVIGGSGGFGGGFGGGFFGGFFGGGGSSGGNVTISSTTSTSGGSTSSGGSSTSTSTARAAAPAAS